MSTQHISIWEQDTVQFPRLLAEINAAGLTDEQYRLITRSTGLTRDDIDAVFDRAEVSFFRAKHGYLTHCPLLKENES